MTSHISCAVAKLGFDGLVIEGLRAIWPSAIGSLKRWSRAADLPQQELVHHADLIALEQPPPGEG